MVCGRKRGPSVASIGSCLNSKGPIYFPGAYLVIVQRFAHKFPVDLIFIRPRGVADEMCEKCSGVSCTGIWVKEVALISRKLLVNIPLHAYRIQQPPAAGWCKHCFVASLFACLTGA